MTSSAVVGSSQSRTEGLRRQRDGDHHPLAECHPRAGADRRGVARHGGCRRGEELDRALAWEPTGRAERCAPSRPPDRAPTVGTGSRALEGVLEDNRHTPACREASVCRPRVESRAKLDPVDSPPRPDTPGRGPFGIRPMTPAR